MVVFAKVHRLEEIRTVTIRVRVLMICDTFSRMKSHSRKLKTGCVGLFLLELPEVHLVLQSQRIIIEQLKCN